MLPPLTTVRFASKNSLLKHDEPTQYSATLFILPTPLQGSKTNTTIGDSIQQPSEPPIYLKLLQQEDDWRASGILHDFNNQLAIILSHCSIALTKLPTDSKARTNLERSVRATKRAADLSSQLHVGRIAQDEEFSAVDINKVLREAVEDLEPRLLAFAELIQNYAAELSSCLANRTLLHRVFVNILANAAEAMYQRTGTMYVTTKKITVPIGGQAMLPNTPPGNYALIEIRDEGHGMDQATLEQIFSPYFSTKAIGSGIGLTTALHIIQLHQGIIYIRSTINVGTIFQILLPQSEQWNGSEREGMLPN